MARWPGRWQKSLVAEAGETVATQVALKAVTSVYSKCGEPYLNDELNTSQNKGGKTNIRRGGLCLKPNIP